MIHYEATDQTEADFANFVHRAVSRAGRVCLLNSPAAHQDCAHSQDHWSHSVVKFEAPVVDRDLVWGNYCRDDPGEGADEDVGHQAGAMMSASGPILNSTED